MGQPGKRLAVVPRLLGEGTLQRIGNTPLLRFGRLTRGLAGVEVLAKAEWANPGGSVKDRPAANIVAEALSTGEFRPDKTLLDSTSGNTGIAYAMLGAAQGFAVTLCMPRNISEERKRTILAFGAEIIFTDAGEGSDGAIRKARELAAKEPGKYFYADQYSSDANWRAHYSSTAEEIWQQTEGRVTHFVAMLGTSGTFVGTSRKLKDLNRQIRCISVQPDSPFHGIEGAKHMASSIVPNIYDPSVADQEISVTTEEAHQMLKRLAREEGLLVGISGAGAMAAALRVAEQAQRGSVIVTIFPDSGDRYLSESFWDDF
jgi:S-sulfo-L-cysteine synthase (O-acetyl-L-serine-dependent)